VYLKCNISALVQHKSYKSKGLTDNVIIWYSR